MLDLIGANVPFGYEDFPKFSAGLGLLAQGIVKLISGDVAGGHQQFAQPERTGGRGCLMLLKIKQGLKLAFGEHAKPDEHLAKLFSAPLLLLDGLIELFAADMSRMNEKSAQQLPLTSRHLHSITQVVEVFLYEQGSTDITRFQHSHPDQNLPQEFVGMFLLIQGMFKTLGGQQFTIQ
jgi:hypothetical protein